MESAGSVFSNLLKQCSNCLQAKLLRMYPATSCLPCTNSFESAGHRMLSKSERSTVYVTRTAAGSNSVLHRCIICMIYCSLEYQRLLHNHDSFSWRTAKFGFMLESWTALMGYFQLNCMQSRSEGPYYILHTLTTEGVIAANSIPTSCQPLRRSSSSTSSLVHQFELMVDILYNDGVKGVVRS